MIARFNGNVVPFADDSTSTNRTVFGGTTQSDLIDDNLNTNFKKGWEIVGLNDNPTREDFNAMGYTLGALTAYLYEIGISEWNTSQNYRVNSRVIGSDGNLYKSLTGTSGTPNVGNNPLSDVVNWKSLEAVYLTGNQTVAGVKTFSLSPIVPTPTTTGNVITMDNIIQKTAVGIGYGNGSGSSVIQLINKNTNVHCPTPTGTIITTNSSLSAGATAQFTVVCPLVSEHDTIQINCKYSGGIGVGYVVNAASNNGDFLIQLKNTNTITRTDNVYITYTVLKGNLV